MESFINMNIDKLKKMLTNEMERYNKFKEMNLKLDMSRGKPGANQLDISEGYLTAITDTKDCYSEAGFDCRNYGILEGLPEMKKLFGDILEIAPDNILVGGNSSLSMMYDTLVKEMIFGNVDSHMPWSKCENIKFLCPVPGYDRHFLITQTLGFELINIKMTENGPDMDEVERLVATDPSIKGIWCVPKYSNPDGITYSDEVVKRLASMKTAASDFRIMYDNAYVIHHLGETEDKLLNIMDECIKYENENRLYIFTSTSKVVFPGAGVCAMAASKENIEFLKKHISVQTIGPDKLNQLRHLKFFGNFASVKSHMKKHAEILKPKFQSVLDILEKELAGQGIASWNKPNGGYFISLFTLEGTAKEAVRLAKECGVTMTPAGATYPCGNDPEDSNIRIAPTFPSVDELKTAIEILCICVKIATLSKLSKDI